MKRILLLDGTALVFRGYYAFIGRPLTNSKGENISAVYSVLRWLVMLIRDYQPDTVISAFDVSRDTFRKEMYADYKAHREEAPQDLKTQIPQCIEAFEKLGVPVFAMKGYEADDILATLARKYQNDEVLVVTGDKDLLQLVGGNISVLRPEKSGKFSRYHEAEVFEKLGVRADQVTDYLAILGDKSDNIPGVKGIGQKGAEKLLSDYDHLEEIYDHIDEITGATQKKLIESREEAFLSKTLATVKYDLEVDESAAVSFSTEFLKDASVEKYLREREFYSILRDLEKLLGQKGSLPEGKTPKENLFEKKQPEADAALFEEKKLTRLDGKYRRIKSLDELSKSVQNLMNEKEFAFDTETTGKSASEATLCGISISAKEKEGVYIPVYSEIEEELCLPLSDTMEILKPLFQSDQVKIAHNAKYDFKMLARNGLTVAPPLFDTMIGGYLLNPTGNRYSLDKMAEDLLSYETISYSEVVEKGETMATTKLEKIVPYAAEDADMALRLKPIVEEKVLSSGLGRVFEEIELPLIPILSEMELCGILLDIPKMKGLSKETGEMLSTLQSEIYDLAGHELNIQSTKQLGEVFYDELKLPVLKKTPKGKPSTDEETLNRLASLHPLPEKIVEFRTVAKLKNTYIDVLPELADKNTSRISTVFHQAVTATGRLSSSDPNLQNIPVRDKLGSGLGKEIRRAFISKDGYSLLSADYSQVELRVLAHFSGNTAMKNAFAGGHDIHSETASLIFGMPADQVDAEMRRRAKSVNFGIIYGLQAFGLARQLDIPQSEASEFIKSYYDAFPEVQSFMDETLDYARQNGEVRTLYGRRRSFPELLGKKRTKTLNHAERMAVNSRVQGTAADLMKLAMIRVSDELLPKFPEVKMLLQIHDELIFEVPDHQTENFGLKLKEIMETPWVILKEPVSLDVPLVVEIGIAKNWADAH